uniref:Putative ovule protein n=1 Tax=Solanum chacoense TaxID=4108 RepID=A0A0V0I7S0_SOLCH
MLLCSCEGSSIYRNPKPFLLRKWLPKYLSYLYFLLGKVKINHGELYSLPSIKGKSKYGKKIRASPNNSSLWP